MMNKTLKWVSASVLALAITGCASHKDSKALSDLETQYNQLASQPFVNEYAPVALKEAEEAITTVKKLEKEGDKTLIKHHQYIAQLKLDTALAVAKHKRAEAAIGNAEVRRKDALLNAKEQEVDSLRNRAAVAEYRASQSEAAAREMAAKAEALAKTLQDFSAKQSERGLVLTMGNILFELNKSTLRPGAERTLEKVAAFLTEYPNRSVLIEGFTDSLGSSEYNQDLSERRAESVVNELQRLGISSSRLSSKGYGEEYPVATNNTDAGRQQNRRVELIIANEDQTSVSPRN